MRRAGASTSWRRCGPGTAVTAAHAAVREISPHLDADRSLSAEIEALAGRMRDGSLLAAVERGSAPLR